MSGNWDSQLAVSEDRLREQLLYLTGRGYVGFTLSEAEHRRQAGTLPPKALIVTFDDGYASTMKGLPVLTELGVPGTVFVVTRFVDNGDPLHWFGMGQPDRESANELRSLTWEDLRTLREAGWEIGSHTVSHPLLTELDDRSLRGELHESRRRIAEELGSCTSVAYPYGRADHRVAREAERAGYEVGCTQTFVHMVDEPLRRPRVAMAKGDRGMRLRLQLSTVGLATRRSGFARLARKIPRRRTWLPGG